MKYPRCFEIIRDGESYRLPVPGGWHHVYIFISDDGVTASSIFVPDPNHEWPLEAADINEISRLSEDARDANRDSD
jgi:hypothetical protein